LRPLVNSLQHDTTMIVDHSKVESKEY
jgi:hypothetical protein